MHTVIIPQDLADIFVFVHLILKLVPGVHLSVRFGPDKSYVPLFIEITVALQTQV